MIKLKRFIQCKNESTCISVSLNTWVPGVCIVCGTPCSGVQVGVYYCADFEYCIYNIILYMHTTYGLLLCGPREAILPPLRVRAPRGMALQLDAQTESNHSACWCCRGSYSCVDDSTDKRFLSKALKNLLTVHACCWPETAAVIEAASDLAKVTELVLTSINSIARRQRRQLTWWSHEVTWYRSTSTCMLHSIKLVGCLFLSCVSHTVALGADANVRCRVAMQEGESEYYLGL